MEPSASAANDNSKTKSVFTYNTLGQKIKMNDPDMGEWKYDYDTNGNLISQTDNKKQTITFNYDKLNRLKKKTYPAGSTTPSVTYTYDNPQISTNSTGRLAEISSNIAKTTYNQYDSMGRILKITKDIIGKGAKTTDYAYDILGRQKTMVYPYSVQNDYSSINYSYYPGTILIKEAKNAKGVVISGLKDFTPSGKIEEIHFGNNTKNIYKYDPLSHRLQSILTQDASNSTIQHKQYSYSPAGDIESINDPLKHVTHSYKYDHLHRLTEETSTGVETFNAMELNMSYDDSNLNVPLHAPQKVNTQNKDHAYSFDANGNMVNTWDFADPTKITKRVISKYTADNMPETIQYGNQSVSFKYDGENKRVMKISPAGESLYYFKHLEVLKGKETGYVFIGDLRVAKVENNEITYYHKDHLGSPTVLSNALGVKKESTEYLPFGMTRGKERMSDTNYTFTDQEWDGATGLFNYDARLYDPAIGMFVSPDSIIPDIYDPQSWNRYSYVVNNPLSYTDPTGHYVKVCSRPLPDILGKLGFKHSAFNINGEYTGYHGGGSGGIHSENSSDYDPPSGTCEVVDETNESDQSYQDFLDSMETQSKYNDDNYSWRTNNCNNMVQDGLEQNGDSHIKVGNYKGLKSNSDENDSDENDSGDTSNNNYSEFPGTPNFSDSGSQC